ncbi:MAG: vitamin K epoxide reductase family protein [Planctomycetaceae bacterium]
MSVKLFHPSVSQDLSIAAPLVGQASTAACGPLCSSRLVWICRSLSLTGLSISLYLAWSALQMQPVAGCGAAGVVNCEHVLGSEWSKVGGVPVSIPAVALYGSLLALLSFAGRPATVGFHRLLWQFLTAGFLSAGLAAIWFISIQVGVIGHICPWCMGAHTCSLILAGIALFKAPVSLAVRQQSGAIAVLGAGLLALVQLGTEPPEPVVIPAIEQPPGDNSGSQLFAPPSQPQLFAPPAGAAIRRVSPVDLLNVFVAHSVSLPLPRSLISGFLSSGDEGTTGASADNSGGAPPDEPAAPAKPAKMIKVSLGGSRGFAELDVYAWPLIGSPTAPCVFVELFDYTCPHCRANHLAITATMKKLGPDVAMIALPVPLHRNCNAFTSSQMAGSCELSELAVAVWRCNPAVFPQYHDWLMASARQPAAARAQAETLVGKLALDTELQTKASGTNMPKKFIEMHVQLYRSANAGVLPKLLFPDLVAEGAVSSAWLQNRLQNLLPVTGGASPSSAVAESPAVAGQPTRSPQGTGRRRK